MNIDNSSLLRTSSLTPYATSNGIGVNVQGDNTQMDAQLGLGSSGITGGSISSSIHSDNGTSFGSASFDSKGNFTGVSISRSSDNGTSFGSAGFDSKGHFTGGSIAGSIKSDNGTSFGGAVFDSEGHFSRGSMGVSSNGNTGLINFNHKGDPTGVSVGTSKGACSYTASISKGPDGGLGAGVGLRCGW